MPDAARSEADQIAELFHEVVDLDVAARRRIYEQRAVSASVRAEVESLLGEEPLPAFDEQLLSSAGRRIGDRLTSEPMAQVWDVGTEVGDYEIVREIARGGMGVVYEAQQRSLARRVAIKVVRGAQYADEAEQQRFRSEAEAIARLEHSGIVPVYEVAQHEGHPFFSMAFLAGGSLKDLETPLDPRRAAELVAEICDAIHHAHSQNIVHRDLKPANVLLTESQQPRVSDFGLAKDVGEESDLTHTGAILGTPGFMAPEQATGRNDKVGHLADVYGLGGVLFYLLTGKAPIEGEHFVEILHKVIHEDAADVRRLVPTVPADLASICRRSLEKAPGDRYGSAAAMARDLRRFLAGEPTEARPLSTSQRFWKWCLRRPALASLSAVATVAVFGGGVSSYLFALEAQERAADLGRANGELRQSNLDLAVARDRAQAAQRDAESFSSFLLDDVIGKARPLGRAGGLGVNVSVREVLVASLPKLAARFEGNPVREAQARTELGVTLRHTGEFDRAIEQLKLALDLRRREFGPDDERTIHTANSYATALYTQSRLAESVPILEDLVQRVVAHDRNLQATVFENMGANYGAVGRFGEKVEWYTRALAQTDDETKRASLWARLAGAYGQNKQPERAREALRKARAFVDAHEFETPFLRADLGIELVSAYESLGDFAALREFTPEVLVRARSVFSPVGRRVIQLVDILVQALLEKDLMAEAAEVLQAQFELDRRHDGAGFCAHGELLAQLYMLTRRQDQAIDTGRIVRDRWLATEPTADGAFVIDIEMAQFLAVGGRRPEAKKLLEQRVDLLRAELDKRPSAKLRDCLAQFELLIEKL